MSEEPITAEQINAAFAKAKQYFDEEWSRQVPEKPGPDADAKEIESYNLAAHRVLDVMNFYRDNEYIYIEEAAKGRDALIEELQGDIAKGNKPWPDKLQALQTSIVVESLYLIARELGIDVPEQEQEGPRWTAEEIEAAFKKGQAVFDTALGAMPIPESSGREDEMHVMKGPVQRFVSTRNFSREMLKIGDFAEIEKIIRTNISHESTHRLGSPVALEAYKTIAKELGIDVPEQGQGTERGR